MSDKVQAGSFPRRVIVAMARYVESGGRSGGLLLAAALLLGLTVESISAAPILFKLHTISATVYHPTSVFAADIDGDGTLDPLSAANTQSQIVWYESKAPRAHGIFTPRIIASNAQGAWDVFAADLDGDGDVDVLSASSADDKIAWYENDGSAQPAFVEHVITTQADLALGVFAIDLDGDGDTDVLSASYYDDKIAWYENDGQRPPSFTTHIITEDPDGWLGPAEGLADGAFRVTAADLDGDGDPDVLAFTPRTDTLYWYENDGGTPPVFTPRVVGVDTLGFGFGFNFVVDIDGDGDLDILVGSERPQSLIWFDNNGARPPVFTKRTIPTSSKDVYAISAADLDGDGDVDVVTSSFYGQNLTWHENLGGTPPLFRDHVVAGIFAGEVMTVDLDGDGDQDILMDGGTAVRWLENKVILPFDIGPGPLGRRGRQLSPRLHQVPLSHKDLPPER